MSWEAPGYVADELLGFGASGEVWRGRDTSTGEVVALKRLRVGRDPAEHDALRREAALLAGFQDPHVVGLRAALCTRDGLVLVLDHAAGGSLGGLLARYGCLSAGQVAALLAPIAGALAAAHAAGLVHGDISGGNILLDDAGRPLIADLGTARLLGEAAGPVHGTSGFLDPAVVGGRPPSPTSDVYALGALAVIAMAGPAAAGDPAAAARQLADPEPVVQLLRRMLQADPGTRPSAGEVAAELDRAALVGPLPMLGLAEAPVSPVALTHAVPGRLPPEGPAGRHRGAPAQHRLRLRIVAGLAAVVAVAAAAGLGFWWGGAQPGRQPTRALAAKPSWSQIWARLDARRAQAFAAADATVLDQVYLPGCPALPVDLRAVRSLAAQHTSAVGVRHEAVSVALESAGAGTATLHVVDRMSGYRVVDGANQVVAQAQGRGERSWRAHLVRTERGWLIAQLTPA